MSTATTVRLKGSAWQAIANGHERSKVQQAQHDDHRQRFE